MYFKKIWVYKHMDRHHNSFCKPLLRMESR